MTVAVQNTKLTVNGNDSATVFSFSPLVIFATTDLEVTHVTSTGVETLLVEGVGAANYSVQVTTFPGFGNVTYPADEVTPLPTGESLVIKRVLTLEQLTNLENQGGYFPETQERQYDKFVMLDLQQQEELDRTIKIPVSSVGSINTELPAPIGDEFLKWNTAANKITTAATSAGVAVAGVTLPVDTVHSTGVAVVGVAADYSREDHVHKQPSTTARTDIANTFAADQIIPSITDAVSLISTDATAAQGPDLVLFRDSVSPANNDITGAIVWEANNDAAAKIEYGKILSTQLAVAAAGEWGRLDFWNMHAGTYVARMYLLDGLYMAGATGADKGTDTINAVNFYRDGVAAAELKNIQTFIIDGTYTPTAGMVRCEVEVYGAGGGGGGSTATNLVGAGAGGGGYAYELIEAATIGASQVVTVGTGGAGGASGANNGVAGGTTSLGSLIQATGGALGTGSGTTGLGGAGGVGSLGDINLVGGRGYSGGTESISDTAMQVGGACAGPHGGQASGGKGLGNNGYAGVAPGGGGSGGISGGSSQAGGAGADGMIIIKEYF